ncbi:MAG TPA: hypothetical protein ENH05_01310, partial [Rhizobiales bacterium]|nr:hypothetical protein [Hyphomicrobiales bacterium]
MRGREKQHRNNEHDYDTHGGAFLISAISTGGDLPRRPPNYPETALILWRRKARPLLCALDNSIPVPFCSIPGDFDGAIFVPTSVLIDNAREGPGHAALYEAPRRIIRADTPGEVSGALAALEAARKSGAHLAGYFSYELGYALEPRFAQMMPGGRRVPLLWFGAFDQVRTLEGREVEDYLDASATGRYRLSEPELTMSAQSYGTRFARVKSYIAAGDIYQLNLTLKGRFRVEGDPVALYRDLRRKQPVSYAALLRCDDFTVISASPELFLRIEGERVVTRPMKGTAARGLTLQQDNEIGQWL